MKTEGKILIAFLLNLGFSIFEFVGGIFTGSVAIASDAIHDLADAVGIGISLALEKKSKGGPDSRYTYGYARYAVLGSLITTVILMVGSAGVLWNAVGRIATPREIHRDGMILFAVVGVAVNLGAALVTREGASMNRRAVNLHMLEDVLGWAVVLVGAVVMRFTDWWILDPLMSMGVAIFILSRAMENLGEITALFLEKAPKGLDAETLKGRIMAISGVLEVHHIHIRSLDGHNYDATMHIVTNEDSHTIKARLREELRKCGIGHITLELEREEEHCHEKVCHSPEAMPAHHH